MRGIIKHLLSMAILLIATEGFAQSPPGINYQGVARDTDGKPLTQKQITIRINILQNSGDGDVEYSEIHSVTTNAFGLFTLVIGAGSAEVGDFQYITWALGNKWLRVDMDPDGGNSFQQMGSQQFMSVPYAFYAKFAGQSADDDDTNKTNELNEALTLGSDNVLRLTDAGGTKEADLSGLITPGSTPQDLSLSGDKLKITDNAAATEIDLGIYKDNTDAQQLSIASDQLSITGGNAVDLAPYRDNTDAQNLSLSGTSLSISGGTGADLSPFKQDLSRTGNTLSLTNDATPVDLSPYLDNTDNQNLSLSGTSLSISGGTGADLSPFKQDLSRTGNTLSLTNDATPVDLSPYLDNTDNQDLSLTGNTLSLTNDATSINLAPYLDNTDSQNLSFSGTTLSISGGTGTDLSALKQDLSRTGNTLSLTNDATTVDLSPYLDNTDNQDLSLTGNTLSLTNDATTVNLAPYLDNTDSQNLSLSGTNLSISGGAGVDLTPFKQNLSSSVSGFTRTISISNGTQTTIDIRDDDADATNEVQDLKLEPATDILSLSLDATPVDLSAYKDNTDNQTLTLTGDNLMITNGNTISLAGYKDNDGDATNELQTLNYTAATKNLSISGGNAVTITETQNLNQVLVQGSDAGGQHITNLGAPTANSDATTKQYVDAADNALSARISANYAFKADYSFNAVLAVSEATLPLTAEFDDFGVVGTSSFTAPTPGTYIFVLDGKTTGILLTAGVNLQYNGTKYPVTVSNNQYNSTFMFRLTAGQTVTVVATGVGVGSNVVGTFYGYKLL